MAKNITTEDKQKALVRKYLTDNAPRAVKMALEFMFDHMTSDDKDLRKDALKIYHKYFDRIAPTTQKIEHTNNNKQILDPTFAKALEMVIQNSGHDDKQLGNSITEIEAIEIRNIPVDE